MVFSIIQLNLAKLFFISEVSILQFGSVDRQSSESIDKFQHDIRMITNEVYSILVGEEKLFSKYLPESIIKEMNKKISNIDDNFRKRFSIHQKNREPFRINFSQLS